VEATPQQGTPFAFTRRKSRVAIAYRDLWTEIQTSAFGRHIELTAEDRAAAHAQRGARPPRRPSPRLAHRPT